VNFDSPFGQLALIPNRQWLSVLLYVDAVVSPAIITTRCGSNARRGTGRRVVRLRRLLL
jgi:hypothetical protein